MPQPFPVDPALTAIVVGYRNTSFIADEVLPRVPVGKREFKYNSFPVAESFALPDTKVGRRGVPNQIELTATETPSAVEDFGLDDVIPQDDIDNAPANYNPVDRAVMQLTDYVMLDREKRTADLVMNAANYPTGNKVTLSGTDQFSDFDDSDPIGVMQAGLDACLMRPNIGVFGQDAWSKFAMHPAVLKAVHGNSGDAGIARRRAVADLFELEEIYIGQARVNTARKGQAAVLARVWPKSIALLYRNKLADTQSGVTFGFTAQWGGKVAGQMPEGKIGLRGGQRVRSGESLKELIVASQAGYLIKDAVA